MTKPEWRRWRGKVLRRDRRPGTGVSAAAGVGAFALVVACGEAGPPVPEASLAEILAARGTADAALQQDRLQDARAEYQRLVEMAPAEAAGYAGLGLTALKAADYETAEENLVEARERVPDDPELALALATLRIETGDFEEARALLDETLAADPGHARSLWGLAELEARAAGLASDARVDVLARLASAAPGNLAALATLADAQLARGELDDALGTLESLRQIAPDFRDRPRAAFEAAEDAILDGDAPTARSQFAEFRAAFEVTSPYQASLEELRQPGGPLAGVAQLDFSFLVSLRVQEPEAVLASLRYTEASDLAGLAVLSPSSEAGAAAEAPVAAAMAIGDFDGDGDEDLLWSRGGEGRVLRVDLGRYVDASDEVGPIDAGDAETALWVDFDDDRRLDVWFAGSTPRAYRNDPAGGFGEIALPRLPGRVRPEWVWTARRRARPTQSSRRTSTRTGISTCSRRTPARTASSATTATSPSPRWRTDFGLAGPGGRRHPRRGLRRPRQRPRCRHRPRGRPGRSPPARQRARGHLRRADGAPLRRGDRRRQPRRWPRKRRRWRSAM
ncbi:tetratricopeptide repeat protein [Candidatus Palauibacter sp.]|uniref:tetratricopeptide repeat protein n=1 Tax=Candidatus Palauibacter sp. TaxID=3101350 RepID=UPI003AF2EE77